MAEQRKRGSLIDVVNLVEYPFWYEPNVRGREVTTYADQFILGNRLPSKQWLGKGGSEIRLDIFLLDQTTMLSQLEAFRSLLLPQDDIGAPHPVYIVVGGMYPGRWFVLEHMEVDPEGYQYGEDMTPYEVRMRLKLCEIPTNITYTGTGV
jgi:hypothetical protein